MGRVHELNALNATACGRQCLSGAALQRGRVALCAASSLRARPSARLPVSCGGARRQALCAVAIADIIVIIAEKAS